MKQPCTLIFDIGKSNKKLFLFDQDLRKITQEYVRFEEIEDDDGFPSENISALISWINEKIEQIIKGRHFDLQALNFATYGASLVNIDNQGNVITPFYNYLKPFPRKLKNEFFEKYYGEEEFSMITSSPSLGLLNSGLQLYFLKHSKPAFFSRIHKSIHFPQYLSSLFTKKFYTDYTSLGCHTGMWDFKNCRNASWLERENLIGLLPPIKSSRTAMKVNIHEKNINIGIGVHDSSSNLIPYLMLKEPFILISTGSWSICLNPFSNEELTRDELRNDCLQFLTIKGRPVKASRLFLGKHFNQTVRQLTEYFRVDSKFYKNFEWDMSFKNKRNSKKALLFDHSLLAADRFGFISNPHPDFSIFQDFKGAYLSFMDELTDLQVASLNLAVGNSNIKKILIDGGFSTNKVFVQLLANKLSEFEVYSTSSSLGTATGAAMLVSKEIQFEKLLENNLGLERHMPQLH